MIGLLVVFVVFTVTASRAASFTSLRDTFTSYVAPASPKFSPALGATLAMFLSLEPATSALACTFSVEAAVGFTLLTSTVYTVFVLPSAF